MALPPAARQGLNLLIQNYESGIQITYKLYSPEEIAAQPSRDHAELYYFPADTPNARYAVVLSGNSLYYSGELRGGVSTAWELHEQGYAVFVLRYRIGTEAGNNAPMDDLGRAIQFITANAETFGVQPEGYALLGYSSGGQIAGVFGDAEKGWLKYNVPKPGGRCCWRTPSTTSGWQSPPTRPLLDVDDWMQKHYYDYTLSKLIAPDYPPVFLWYGKSDRILKLFGFDQQGGLPSRVLWRSTVCPTRKRYMKTQATASALDLAPTQRAG